MALNLSTLTSPATSGDVLAEALTTADFLEPVPVLRNLARGSQKGGDAKQDVALNQPKALPLDANGKGYLYLSGVSGNDANVPDAANLDGFGDFTLQVDNLYLPDWTPSTQVTTLAKGSSWQFSVHTSGSFRLDMSGVSSVFSDPTGLPDKTTASIRAVRAGSVFTFFYSLNDGATWVSVPYNFGGGSGVLTNVTQPLAIGSANLTSTTLGKVSGAKVWNNATQSGTPVLDVDFTATNVRHGDTKFKCGSGQVVTINQAGNDPATIIKKPVLRFDGADDGFKGLFDQTITDGAYMFAAFSVLGSGGDSWGRVFTVNKTGGFDYNTTGNIFSAQVTTTGDLAYAVVSGSETSHPDLFDDENGDILHQVKVTNSAQSSLVNGADFQSKTDTLALEAQEFNIGKDEGTTVENAAIDLEYLALFPATITDAQADSVRNYINNRNNVFDLKDGFGYYFFDPQIFPIVSPAAFVSYWNGNIVGSDNTLNASVSQSTVNDQPTRDGYKVTFNDNADHLVVASPLSGGQAGWQVVGTSLGTFAYRVNANAVTELNLLGNLGNVGNAIFRQTGDSYGMLLLPESATGADIESARKLLIDRGSSDGTTSSSIALYFYGRSDIVEFNSINVSSATSLRFTWFSCSSLNSFPPLDIRNGNDFTSTWQNCSSLQSFPAGAKLGTSASNVNFAAAWQSSGLTSFSTPLPTATNCSYAWNSCTSLSSFGDIDISSCSDFTSAFQYCSALTSFPQDAKLGTSAQNVNFTSAWRDSGLTSFPADIDLSKGSQFLDAWHGTNLTSFSTPITGVNAKRMRRAWKDCDQLTDFSYNVFANWNPSVIQGQCFNSTWDGCTALTADSVGNILRGIDASNQFATVDGNSGSAAITDAGIDIDYNVATGSLSAATNSAIDSLSGKGWEVFINGVLVIPNILDLAPAAAYSLRSFDADADPNVVNVRRSSDGATSDFTASEVSDGTLTSWVNTEYNRYTSDFSSGTDSWSSDGGNTYAYNQSVSGVTGALKITNVSNNYGYKAVGAVNGLAYRFTAKVYIPSSNTSLNALKFRFGYVPANEWMTESINTLDQWVTVTVNSYTNPATSGAEKLYWYHDSSATSGDVFYLKDVQLTQLTADGHVTTWYDQSSNGRDSSQSSASAQPKIVDAGTLVTDSANNPAIIGDGVDDTLFHPTLTDEIDSSDFLVTAAYEDDLTMGIVGAIPRLYLTSSSMSYITLGTVGYPTQTGRNVTSFQVAGNTQEVFGNGASLGTASEAQVDIGQNMFNVLQGGSNFSDAPLMEVIVFGNNQSANRTGIEKNINDHFDIYS